MDTALIVALVTAAVTAIGWVANYILAGRARREDQRIASSLRYLERQLEELYGPLNVLVSEGKQTFQVYLETSAGGWFSRHSPGGPSDDERDLWVFWIENDFFPRNEKIKNLLAEKSHLVEGDSIPLSYSTFLDHYNSWKIRHLLWRKTKLPYPYDFLPHIVYPQHFNDEVLSMFRELKARYSELLGRRTHHLRDVDVSV